VHLLFFTQKSIMLVWQCHQLLARFLPMVTCPEYHISHICRLMIRVMLGAMHRFSGICLIAEEQTGQRFTIALKENRKTKFKMPVVW